MADFQSSKTAAEIEEVLTGALLYNAAQILTEGEKAFVREKIGATAQGEGIKIISHFDSLEELEAAVPNPNAGDAYSIGEVMPYNLYIYDFYHESWVGHGPIRANDISARFAQNVVVAMSAWEEDTDVFPDYTYKASIPLAEITGNDFPIVAFSPSDAVGGKFCPICFAFDGYIEVWAQSVPDTDITIPAITFILQETEGAETGNSTKGITNAGGGIATGGIGTAQIADESITVDKVAAESRTQGFEVTIPTDWDGDSAPFSRSLALEGILKKDRPKVFYMPPAYLAEDETHREAFSKLFTVDSEDGVIIFTAKEKTEVAITVYVEVNRI